MTDQNVSLDSLLQGANDLLAQKHMNIHESSFKENSHIMSPGLEWGIIYIYNPNTMVLRIELSSKYLLPFKEVDAMLLWYNFAKREKDRRQMLSVVRLRATETQRRWIIEFENIRAIHNSAVKLQVVLLSPTDDLKEEEQ